MHVCRASRPGLAFQGAVGWRVRAVLGGPWTVDTTVRNLGSWCNCKAGFRWHSSDKKCGEQRRALMMCCASGRLCACSHRLRAGRTLRASSLKRETTDPPRKGLAAKRAHLTRPRCTKTAHFRRPLLRGAWIRRQGAAGRSSCQSSPPGQQREC